MPPDLGNMPEPIPYSATSDTPAVEPAAPPAPEPVPAEPDEAPLEPAPEPSEPPAEPADPAEPPAAAKGTNRFGERLSEMAAARRAAEARADKLADSLEKAVDALSRTTQRPAAPEPQDQPDPRPARDQFADPDSYDAALIEWSSRTATRLAAAEFEKTQAANREREQREEAERAQQQHHEAATARWTETRTKLMDDPQYQDFAEVAENPDLNIPMTMVPALLEAENGPQVLYHLGKNPQEAARIAGLAPMRQVIEIGRLSAMLEQPERPPVRKPIPAVEPVGTRAPAGPKDPNEMTTEEWAAQRMPQLQAERRAGMWGRPPH